MKELDFLQTTIFLLNDLKGFAEQHLNDDEVYLYKLYIDKNIAELEELIKPKSCNGCKHLLTKSRICTKQVQLHNGSLPENFYCNRYEPKEIK